MANSRGGSPYEPGSAHGSHDSTPHPRSPRPQGPGQGAYPGDPYAVEVYLSTTGPQRAQRPPRGDEHGASRSGAHRAVHPPAVSGSHRRRAGGRSGDESRRSRRRRGGRLGLAGVVAGVVGIGVVAVSIFLLRSGGGGHGSAGSPAGTPADDGYPHIAAPATGTVLSVATPDPFTYGIGGIKGGVTSRPLTKGGTPPPPGGVFAYGDYVLSNTGSQPALLDFTAVDLFVKQTDVPASAQARCMPQPGTPPDMCTLPNNASIQAVVNGSKAPVNENGQPYLLPGSKVVIRVETTMPVLPSTTQQDESLQVWQARYIANRKAVPVPFP